MARVSPPGRHALFQASGWEMTDPESPPSSPSHRSEVQTRRLSQSPSKQTINCLNKFALVGTVELFCFFVFFWWGRAAAAGDQSGKGRKASINFALGIFKICPKELSPL